VLLVKWQNEAKKATKTGEWNQRNLSALLYCLVFFSASAAGKLIPKEKKKKKKALSEGLDE
jgi:hypothetical protein